MLVLHNKYCRIDIVDQFFFAMFVKFWLSLKLNSSRSFLQLAALLFLKKSLVIVY